MNDYRKVCITFIKKITYILAILSGVNNSFNFCDGVRKDALIMCVNYSKL